MAQHRRVTNTEVSFRKWYPVVGVLVGFCLLLIGVYHSNQLDIPAWRIPVIMVSFIWMCIVIVAAHFNRPAQGEPPNLRVAVVIPSHNEDAEMLRAMLISLDEQIWLPTAVYFIENGETNGDAERVFREWGRWTRIERAVFIHRDEAGKRGAQGLAFVRIFAEGDIDVIASVDGDTELDPSAIYEGLKPFRDPAVMSVAGLLVGKNRSQNLLTRIVDLGFVSSFMNGRAAWSSFGSVAVNCGGLAFYRAWVLEKHLPEYLGQQLFKDSLIRRLFPRVKFIQRLLQPREVNSGDDRVATGLAALEGRTVFQETSVGYTLLPSNLGHLTRQRGRWWRSWWWGGLWLIRRMSPTRAIWWLVASQYVTFTLYAIMAPLVLIYDPIVQHKFPWVFFVYVSMLSYLRSARTLAVSRPNQSLGQQVGNYLLLAPLVTILNLWLCAALQIWGGLTFYETGWRTRQKVEVGLQVSPDQRVIDH